MFLYISILTIMACKCITPFSIWCPWFEWTIRWLRGRELCSVQLWRTAPILSNSIEWIVVQIWEWRNKSVLFWVLVLFEQSCVKVRKSQKYPSCEHCFSVTAERYFAIVHPLCSRQLMTSRKSRIYKVIVVIWIFAILNALPYALYSEINYISHPITGLVIQGTMNKQRDMIAVL